MQWLHCAAYAFAGLALINAVPHLVSGVMGRSFPTPFSKPPGKGFSTSTVNVLWGFFNRVLAYGFVFHVGGFAIRTAAHAAALGGSVLTGALWLAHSFGN